VMPVAVGIYLPLSLSVPILLGGALRLMVRRATSPQGKEATKEANQRGILFSSGLIAGEAIMGIIIAALIVGKVKLPIRVLENSPVSLFLFAGIISLMAYKALRGRSH